MLQSSHRLEAKSIIKIYDLPNTKENNIMTKYLQAVGSTGTGVEGVQGRVALVAGRADDAVRGALKGILVSMNIIHKDVFLHH